MACRNGSFPVTYTAISVWRSIRFHFRKVFSMFFPRVTLKWWPRSLFAFFGFDRHQPMKTDQLNHLLGISVWLNFGEKIEFSRKSFCMFWKYSQSEHDFLVRPLPATQQSSNPIFSRFRAPGKCNPFSRDFGPVLLRTFLMRRWLT